MTEGFILKGCPGGLFRLCRQLDGRGDLNALQAELRSEKFEPRRSPRHSALLRTGLPPPEPPFMEDLGPGLFRDSLRTGFGPLRPGDSVGPEFRSAEPLSELMGGGRTQ